MRQTFQCESRRLRGCAVVVLLAMVIGAAVAYAQTNPLPTGQYEVVRSSGVHDNPTKEFQMVYQTVIHTDDETPWVRLQFADAHLDGASYLRLTSLFDSAVQHLRTEHLVDWRMSSAYFNGRSVRIELFAAPGTTGNFVEINEVLVGLRSDGPRISSQCGAADDRVLSDEPSAGRLVPVGCTATIYNEASCAITAGHCLGSADVWEFNVPVSLPDGTIVHPGPDDQYAVDPASRIGTAAGVGNDWGHFTCFANSETGQFPFETQGTLTPLATEIPPLPMEIQIFGYGLDFDDRDRSQVQQLSLGPVVHTDGSVGHRADTEGGNSGSAIVDLATGEVIGIHTHGGCNQDPNSFNSGTLITIEGLAQAILDCLGIDFEYPEGLVRFVHPELGATLVARITRGFDQPDPDTVTLWVSVDEGPFIDIPMSNVGEDRFEAALPAVPCGSRVNYYISLETLGDFQITDPRQAPGASYATFGATSAVTLVDEDFETPVGYVVSGDASTGQWETGVPVGCNRGDPSADFDNSGSCFLTGNDEKNEPPECDTDVDFGSTILTSPTFDMTGTGDPYVSYARWFSNVFGNAPETDTFFIEISNDGGANWVNLETVGPGGAEVRGGWIFTALRVADTIEPTDRMQIRWIASDLGEGSIVEAALDALRIELAQCDVDAVLLLPEELNIIRGRLYSGELPDLFESDNSRMVFQPGITQNPEEPPVWLELTGHSVTESPSELAFILETRADTPGVTQTLLLFNYDTQEFEEVDSRVTSSSDSVAEVVVDGDPSRFIESETLEVRAQLTWKPPPLVIHFPWNMGMDQAVWRIVP